MQQPVVERAPKGVPSGRLWFRLGDDLEVNHLGIQTQQLVENRLEVVGLRNVGQGRMHHRPERGAIRRYLLSARDGGCGISQ